MGLKKILIAGGTGFLGGLLQTYFNKKGDQVRILTRHPEGLDQIFWDGRHLGDWIAEVEWADIVINLTGKSVDCRYTATNKKEILNSRLDSTAILVKAIDGSNTPPKLWLNAASATIYIHSETQKMTEDEGIIGDDFSMNVCKKWEAEFFKHDLNHTRRVALRTAIVLGKQGGAFPKLKQLAKCLLGGKQGSGNQFISWVHADDFCRAIEHVMEHPELVGPVNITSPEPIRNSEFMKLLRSVFKRPFGAGQPKWLLELGARIMGTETELLLKSRNVIPERLLENGFKFKFSNTRQMLESLRET